MYPWEDWQAAVKWNTFASGKSHGSILLFSDSRNKALSVQSLLGVCCSVVGYLLCWHGLWLWCRGSEPMCFRRSSFILQWWLRACKQEPTVDGMASKFLASDHSYLPYGNGSNRYFDGLVLHVAFRVNLGASAYSPHYLKQEIQLLTLPYLNPNLYIT